jgi:quinol monooxygenase YgiN
MAKIVHIVSFELNDENLMEDWKKMSAGISTSLQNAPGFISRDSAVGKDKKVYCVLKWESMESQEAVKKMLKSPEMADEMEKFAKIANLQTMTEKFLEVL